MSTPEITLYVCEHRLKGTEKWKFAYATLDPGDYAMRERMQFELELRYNRTPEYTFLKGIPHQREKQPYEWKWKMRVLSITELERLTSATEPAPIQPLIRENWTGIGEPGPKNEYASTYGSSMPSQSPAQHTQNNYNCNACAQLQNESVALRQPPAPERGKCKCYLGKLDCDTEYAAVMTGCSTDWTITEDCPIHGKKTEPGKELVERADKFLKLFCPAMLGASVPEEAMWFRNMKDSLAAGLAKVQREAEARGIERAAQACENEARCYADSHRTHDNFCHAQDAKAIRALIPSKPVLT